MADQYININYTATDIEKYLGGAMTQKEMHEMERAALQDPFLADAIEGYRDMPFTESHKHLNEINASLYSAKDDAKVIPIRKKNYSWISIAAMFIVIAGVGFISWYFLSLQNRESNNQDVALLQEKKAIINAQDSSTTNEPGSTAVISSAPVQSDAAKAKDVYKDKEIIASGKANSESTADASDNATASIPDEDKAIGYSLIQDSITFPQDANKPLVSGITSSGKTAIAPPVAKQDAALQAKVAGLEVAEKRKKITGSYDNNPVIIKGKVTDYNNAPIPFANVKITGKTTAVTTDANGVFNIPATDSNLNVLVGSAGYESKIALLNTGSDNNILLMPASPSLSEIVVSSYGSKKVAKINTAAHSGPAPEGGWLAFNSYIKEELYTVVDSATEADMQISGDLEIEFLIDDDGVPFNFSVVRPLEDAINTKAIEVLKEGPKWIPVKKNRKGKVTIEFR